MSPPPIPRHSPAAGTSLPHRAPTAVDDIRFHNPHLGGLGIDVFSLAALRRRAPHTLLAPQRVQFHLLLLVQQGHSPHWVDFRSVRLQAGDLLWLQPGQVQQWQLHERLQGWLLLVQPEAMLAARARAGREASWLAMDEWPCHSTLASGSARRLQHHLAGLAQDVAAWRQQAAPQQAREAAAIGHALLAVLLSLSGELAAAAQPPSTRSARLVRQAQRWMEQHLGQLTSARRLASDLGCSESTLNRAILSERGQTAKELLDERALLEAKRLLVQGEHRVAAIAETLGFAEPTHLVRFFKRLTGTTPAAYAASLRTTTLPME